MPQNTRYNELRLCTGDGRRRGRILGGDRSSAGTEYD
jgi:hypothetical protein